MILPPKIATLDPRRVRDMFKAFNEADTEYDLSGAAPKFVLRRMTRTYVRDELNLSDAKADEVHRSLIEEGWIDAERLCPAHQGMGLANHLDLPRISREEGLELVERVLDWVDRANADENSRVRIKSIELYGSLERGSADIGDVDIVVAFNTMDLDDGPLPEDMDREDELAAELTAISPYISPATELDKLGMPHANYRQIYPRP